MNEKFRAFGKRLIEYSLFFKIYRKVCSLLTYRVRKEFKSAVSRPRYLDYKKIEVLRDRYSPPTDFLYDSESLKKRGIERVNKLFSLKGINPDKIDRALEVGCWDGMVCYELQRKGIDAFGVDIRHEGFDKRATKMGVDLLRMDANRLAFKKNSFDLVYSFDSFEHFNDPRSVLDEIIRVTNKGGYIYLDFGPLFMSPWGLHAYRMIPVPYCQHLFTREDLSNYVQNNGLGEIDYDSVNGWTLKDFQILLRKKIAKLEVIKYREVPFIEFIELITEHPSCFKSQNDNFDEFITSRIEVLFRKKVNL